MENDVRTLELLKETANLVLQFLSEDKYARIRSFLQEIAERGVNFIAENRLYRQPMICLIAVVAVAKKFIIDAAIQHESAIFEHEVFVTAKLPAYDNILKYVQNILENEDNVQLLRDLQQNKDFQNEFEDALKATTEFCQQLTGIIKNVSKKKAWNQSGLEISAPIFGACVGVSLKSVHDDGSSFSPLTSLGCPLVATTVISGYFTWKFWSNKSQYSEAMLALVEKRKKALELLKGLNIARTQMTLERVDQFHAHDEEVAAALEYVNRIQIFMRQESEGVPSVSKILENVEKCQESSANTGVISPNDPKMS